METKTHQINFNAMIQSKLRKERVKHLCKWLKLKNKTIQASNVSIDYESVENWSCKIHTIRYEGELVLRTFCEDLEGKKFRIEVYYGDYKEE